MFGLQLSTKCIRSIGTRTMATIFSDSKAIVEATEKFVQAELGENDASHDFAHIDRVRKLAVTLAKDPTSKIQTCEDFLVVELGALLHDVKDFKYSGSHTAGPEAAEDFLKSQGQSDAVVQRVVNIVKNVSFRKEISNSSSVTELVPELCVVQDADRLDAIGAIGIARCFTYGGSLGRPMYHVGEESMPIVNLDGEAYDKASKNKDHPTIFHFHEKLLKLKGMMKTEAGARVAEARHQYMLEFLERFDKEINGIA